MAIEKMAHTYGAAMVGGVERIETLSNAADIAVDSGAWESSPRVFRRWSPL